MKKNFEECKCLASLAVFREMYDKQKDVYKIISEFLMQVILENSLHQFSLSLITQSFNDTYDFTIPEAVIKRSLKMLKEYFTITHGNYTILNFSQLKTQNVLKSRFNQIHENNASILKGLIIYIENKFARKLDSKEVYKIEQAFTQFFIDENLPRQYSDYISAYILQRSRDANFTKQLNTIKEGVIVYSGLKFYPELDKISRWKEELTIVLDTEILFYFAGLTGELYRTLFNDFILIVKEINERNREKNKKDLIHLKYFRETKVEIENYYKKAEYIVSGKDKLNPARGAMTRIINGCHTEADVVQKKVNIFMLLQTNNILEDSYTNYYNEENHQYNTTSIGEKLQFSEQLDEDITENLKYLNYINILRKGKNSSPLESIKYLFITGTINTLRLSREKIGISGEIPLAVSLDFMTNALWFKSNKGFGTNNFPKTFNVIAKAQVVLSSKLNQSIAEQYEILKSKYESSEITKDQAIAAIVELRKKAIDPENINQDEVESVLASIHEREIEQYQKENDFTTRNLLREKDKNIELENKYLIESNARKNAEKKNRESENKLEKYEEKERQKEKRKKNTCRIVVSVFAVGLWGLLLYLIWPIFSTALRIVLSLLSGPGLILGILGYFGLDYETVKFRFHKPKKEQK